MDIIHSTLAQSLRRCFYSPSWSSGDVPLQSSGPLPGTGQAGETEESRLPYLLQGGLEYPPLLRLRCPGTLLPPTPLGSHQGEEETHRSFIFSSFYCFSFFSTCT